MKILLLYCIVLVGAIEILASDKHMWEKYKATFLKKYKSATEDKERRAIFLQNLDRVEKHNQKFKNGEVRYRVKINQFSDKTEKELSEIVTCNGENGNKIRDNIQVHTWDLYKPIGDVPNTIDWRSKNAVTPVREQKDCGSCYAIAAIEAAESRRYIFDQVLIPLSVQQIVDCSFEYYNKGCHGGSVENSYEYLLGKHPNISTEQSYPYINQEGNCRFDFDSPVYGARLTRFLEVEPGNEDVLLAAVAEGPVAASINANTWSFIHYDGGIFDSPDCTADSLTYAMSIVGYGTDIEIFGGDYWIVKNSWGQYWGEDGYIRITRDSNMCGIANRVFAPEVRPPN